MAHDLVIRNGTIVDGSGAEPQMGDLAVADGSIAVVGAFEGNGAEEIEAAGMLVTPGSIDVHTHYDGQFTWEQRLAPSSNHGVTTVVMAEGVPIFTSDEASYVTGELLFVDGCFDTG